MVAYIALIAVVNIALGIYLTRAVDLRQLGLASGKQKSADSQPIRPSAEEMPEECSATTVDGSSAGKADDASSTPLTPTDEPASPTKNPLPPTNVKSWDEFAHQLRDLKQRTTYCRPAQDMKLARQAAEQLKACATVWYFQFEKCLLGETLDDATRELVEGADMGAIEMFASQIETTITNVGAIDYTGPVNEVLDLLEKEMALLDSQQKNVAASKKRLVAV
jgi:hypothetical protein